MKSIMTVDLEYDFEGKGTENLDLVPKILDFFEDHKVKATFFVVGKLTESHEDTIKDISKKHEIASHGHTHADLSKLNRQQLDDEIKSSKEAIEGLNIKCHGFRAPFFKTNKALFELLEKNNFKYDSSLSTFFPGRYFNPLLKTKPFKKQGIVELPVPNFLPFLIPTGFSYYRLFHPFSRLFKLKYMFYLHPCEFLEKPIGKEISFLVRQFYKVNKGKKAWSIFKSLIEKTNVEWTSCLNYIEETKLDAQSSP